MIPILPPLDKIKFFNSSSLGDFLKQNIFGTDNTSFEKNSTSYSDDDTSFLEKKLKELQDIADKLKVDGSQTVLSDISDRVSKYAIQKAAVVGRYSTGKSTLINALLQKDFLPSTPTPTTKAITYILKGDSEYIYSEVNEGEIVVHQSLSALNDKDNKDIAAAKKITVMLPDFPFPNVTLIDTPGLNEPDQTISQLTLDMLSETDALIVVLDANYLESQYEFDFISSLLKDDKERKLFIVINKTDGLSSDEVRKIEQKCKSLLASINVNNSRVYSLSAKEGESNQGFIRFKNELFAFLNNDIRQEGLRHAESELNAYSDVLLDACNNAVKMSAMQQQEAMQQREAANNKINQVASRYNNEEKRILRQLEQYKSQFLLDFSDFIARLKTQISREVANSNLDTLRNTDAIAVKAQNSIHRFINDKLSEIEGKLQTDFESSRTEILNYLSDMNLSVDVNIRDYSRHSSLFLPAVVLTTYFAAGFFTAVGALIITLLGKGFFKDSISKWLSTMGVTKAKERIVEEISANIDRQKVAINGMISERFDEIEKQITASFESSRKAAVAPLTFVAGNSDCSLQDVTECRDKLLDFNK